MRTLKLILAAVLGGLTGVFVADAAIGCGANAAIAATLGFCAGFLLGLVWCVNFDLIPTHEDWE